MFQIAFCGKLYSQPENVAYFFGYLSHEWRTLLNASSLTDGLLELNASSLTDGLLDLFPFT
jgi:hypothetical protein